MFLTDAHIASLLFNEARRRTLERLFGISRDSSPLVTVIVLRVLAGLVQPPAPIRKVATRPSVTDTAIGVAALNETAHRIAGDSSRETPFLGPLVAFALIAKYHPVAQGAIRAARGSIRGAIGSERMLRRIFGDRYGRH